MRPQPPVSDVVGIIEHVRAGDSAEYPLRTVPDGLAHFRRRLRQQARRVGIRISVRTFGRDVVAVFCPDPNPAREHWSAALDVLCAEARGQRLSLDTALRARRRQRLRLIRCESIQDTT